jgi:cardiolipin synthase
MRLKRFLVRSNLANQLTFLRLVAVPFFILSVLQSQFGLALTLFVGAAVTDLLDGLTARWLSSGTPLGAWLDPAADKLLLTSAFLLLTEYPTMFRGIELVHRIPPWLTLLTVSRDVLIVAVALVLALAFGARRFPPSGWGKLTSLSEFLTVSAFLLYNTLGWDGLGLEVLVWLTLALTLVSGFHYIARTVRAIGEPPPAGVGP